MAEGLIFANDLKDILEAIDGWTGRVYVYVPPIKTETDFNNYFLEAEENEGGKRRLNAWFVNRTRVSARKYGEAPRRVPLGYRLRMHIYTIKGFVSLISDTGTDLSSEESFQDLCDTIEGALSIPVSLGHTDRTVIVTGVDVDINYDTFGVVLCHVANIGITVSETVATAHTN